jgi:adenine phosphoribosyltransferase
MTTFQSFLTNIELKQKIELVKDYPKPGVTFKNLYPLYLDNHHLASLVANMAQLIIQDMGNFEYIAAIEAQSFILAGALAQQLQKGFMPIRKKGKLPGEILSANFTMQYAESSLEIQKGVLQPESKLLIFDDCIATGQTALTAKQLIEAEGCVVVGFTFVFEQEGLGGRNLVGGSPICTLLNFPLD